MSVAAPTVLTTPWAQSGTRSVVPIAPPPSPANAASYQLGFPPVTMVAEDAGGEPPLGPDTNAVLYDVTSNLVWQQYGQGYAWNAATAAANGGYQPGAVLARADGTGFWLNTTANNAGNPDAEAAGWVPLENYGSTILSGLAGGTVNVGLPAAAKSVIVLQGALTGNVQIILPNTLQIWLIVNQCTGNYTATVKTGAGSGVVVGQGGSSGPQFVWGDGTNIYPAALSVPTLTQTLIGGIIYPRTANEITASAVPVQPWYPPMYVDRYTANTTPGTGTNDMAPAFGTAFRVAKIAGGRIRYGATAPYLCLTPINFTTAGAPNIGGIIVTNDGGPCIGISPPSIIASHNSHVFDMTGTYGIVFEYASATHGSLLPQTMFYQARNNSAGAGHPGPSVGFTRFYSCTATGQFTADCYYNFGAEDDIQYGCYWNNTYPSGPASCCTWTANNVKNLTSTFQTVAAGPQSCIDHQVFGGQFYMKSANSASYCIHLEAIDNIKVYGPWMDCSSGGSGQGSALIWCDMVNSPSNFCEFYGVQGENSTSFAGTASISGTVMTISAVFSGAVAVGNNVTGAGIAAGTIIASFGSGSGGAGTYNITPSQSASATTMQVTGNANYGFFFSGTGGGGTPTGWIIEGASPIPTSIRAFYAAAGVTIDAFHIKSLSEEVSLGLEVVGRVQDSVIETVGLILNIGTSANNSLVGFSEDWGVGAGSAGNIGTRSNDNWTDIGTLNKTWPAALGTVTQSGVFDLQTSSWLFTGSYAEFDCEINSTGVITANAGQTFAGLLVPAAQASCLVNICDASTGAFLSTGFIAAGSQVISVSTSFVTSSGHSIVISGRYKVA
jgi:hypothetical protein